MERESQSTRTRLIKHIEPTIWRANFYRFCQLLEKASPQSPPLGTTDDIKDDPLRFRPWPGMGFPAGELRTVEQHSTKPELPLTVRTNFWGCTASIRRYRRVIWMILHKVLMERKS